METRNKALILLGLAILLVLTFLGFGCHLGSTISHPELNRSFQTVATLSTNRYGLAATAIDDEIYIIGGMTPAKYLGTIAKFDPSDQSTSTLPAKLLPRWYHTVASHEGKIYIIGGVNWGGEIDKVERYDPETNEVELLASLPTPRKMPASVAYNDKIYVIGGSALVGTQNRKPLYLETVEIYDIAANKWYNGKTMPTPRECEIALYDGKIYAIGGFKEMPLNRFEVYDIAADHWERLPNLPFKITAHHGTVLNDKIYIFGDYLELNDVCQYDFAAKKWLVLKTNFKLTRYNAVALCSDTIYIIGGAFTPSMLFLDAIQAFRPPRI